MGLFTKRKRTVAILGCGPAGMFAAHAFVEADWGIIILSKKRKSQMFGAQYLHAPIPGLPEVKATIEYKLWGTAQGYADKVYGGILQEADVSPSLLLGTHPAWDIRAAYDAAYDRYESAITPMDLNAGAVRDLLKSDVKFIVSTIPAPALCDAEHDFTAQKIWAAGDAPELGRICPISCDPNTVICNGSSDRAWYRVSNVFGHTTAEWPYDRRPPLNGLGEVTKPLFHKCDCWAETRVRPLGRYGKWQKGVLSHHAYEEARRLATGRKTV